MPAKESPQINKQHAVPQNIMDVEFKLIGDLTMRQFVYLLVFLGFAYFVFTLNFSIVFRLPIAILSGLAGLAFAFMPLEDRGLDEWVINFFNAIYRENQMVWRKEPTPPSAFVYQNISMVRQELITLAPTASRRKLERYLEEQEQHDETDPFEQLEQSYIQKVQDAYMDFEPQQPETTVTTIETPMQETSEVPTDQTQKESDKETGEEKQEKPKPKVVKKPEPRAPRIQLPREVPLDVITPDRHSGRKFTNLLPDEGSITLPIRGETVIETTQEEKDETVSVNEKAEQLRKFISQIESDKSVQKKRVAQSEGSKLIEELKREKDELETKIERLEQELEQIKNPEEKQRKQNHIRTLIDKKEETSTNIDKLENKIPTLGRPQEIEDEEQIPEYLEPEQPNTIAGVIKDLRGKRVPEILIVIKNNKEEPVRAIKTNSLGEFSITNPLTDGKYQMEIDVNNLTGFNFDIIDFVAEGKIIPAMEIKGK